MDWTTSAKLAQNRAIAVYAARPAHALSTLRGVARLGQNLSCTYEQDGQIILADMPATLGGSDQAPSPGFYGRAAICSCLVIGIRMAAIREDISITSLIVSIDQDWDNRGLFAMTAARPGPLDTRVHIHVDSPAPGDVIEGLVNRAIACDPWLLAFKDSQAVKTDVSVLGSSR